MIKDFREKLAEIVKKEVTSLTPGDIAFLKARLSYLNKHELKKFVSVLKEETPKEVVVTADRRDTLPEGEHPSYRDLQRRASELGKITVVGQTKEQLENYIKTHEPK